VIVYKEIPIHSDELRLPEIGISEAAGHSRIVASVVGLIVVVDGLNERASRSQRAGLAALVECVESVEDTLSDLVLSRGSHSTICFPDLI